MMEYTTPPSYGSTTVNVGGIVKEGEVIYAGTTNSVAHTETGQDEGTDWPAPKSIKWEWSGKTTGNKALTAEVNGALGSRLDRIDVMAEVPGFIKSIAGSVAGTRPYIFQYSPQEKLSLKLKLGDEGITEEGTMTSFSCIKVPDVSDKPQVCANCHFGGNGERCDLDKLQQTENIGTGEEEAGKSSTLNESNLSTTVETHKDSLDTQLPQATADSPIQTAQESPEGLLSLIIAHYELQVGSYDASITSLATILNNLKIQRDLTARTLEVLKGAAAKG
ncbi:unnamed protein product [Penicillium nalgiovense]|nr:unnamed protein product [Penicillium nalgiovense]